MLPEVKPVSPANFELHNCSAEHAWAASAKGEMDRGSGCSWGASVLLGDMEKGAGLLTESWASASSVGCLPSHPCLCHQIPPQGARCRWKTSHGWMTKPQIPGLWGALLSVARTLQLPLSHTFAQVHGQTFPWVVGVPQRSPYFDPEAS